MADGIGSERRSALLAMKLRALVTGHDDRSPVFGDDVAAFAGGAALVADDRLWVLVESGTVGLGAALAWADRNRGVLPAGDEGLSLVVDGEARLSAGGLARQTSHFRAPHTVWVADGRQLVPVEPAPIAPAPEAPAVALGLIDELKDAGLEVTVEHGVVSGEVDGLQVAIVVVDDAGVARIEVGVGRNDREAFALLHGDLPATEAMRKVADTVRGHRREGANPHPLNRMASERWLRSYLLRDPARLPGWSLDAVAGPVARQSVSDLGPAYAFGTDAEGTPVVLACSVGIDLELVPEAADARAWLEPSAHLVLALPARDAHPVTAHLAAALVGPATVLPVEGDWRR